MVATTIPTDAVIQQEFTALLPELSSRLTCRFRRRDQDLAEEQAAEALAQAWPMYVSARRKNKMVGCSSVAYYVIRSVLAGRRLAGTTDLDAFSTTAAARRRLNPVVLLDAERDLSRNFYQVFGDHRWRSPVVDVVATKLDWTAFLRCCDRRDRRIVALRVAGYPQTAIAGRLGISPPAVAQRLSGLRERWSAFSVA